MVIHLDVPDSVLVPRLTARRQCPACKHIYNVISQPPRIPGRCDTDDAVLITRGDDQEEVIRQRLQAYKDQTGPVLKFYGASIVHTVDGAASPDVVAQQIVNEMGLMACVH